MSGPDKADSVGKKVYLILRFFSACSFAEVTRRAGEFSHVMIPGSPHPRMQEGLNKSDFRQEFKTGSPTGSVLFPLVEAVSCPVAKSQSGWEKATAIFSNLSAKPVVPLPHPGVRLS